MPNLKIAALNINNGDGDDKATLSGLAALIRGAGPACAQATKPDIVFINEVGRNTIASGGRDQMRLLAEGAGYPYWVFAARDWASGPDIPLGGELGEGVLSRLPLVPDVHYLSRDAPQVTKLPYAWGPGQKIVLHMEALLPSVSRTGWTPLHLYVTRWNPGDAHQQWRVQSAQMAVTLIASSQGPAVFGGDLNELPGGPAIQVVRSALRDSYQVAPYPPPTCDGTTTKHCAADDADRVDYVFFRDQAQGPFQVPWYKGWCNEVTDHPLVVTQVVREEPTECATLRTTLQSLYQQRQALYDAKAGLDPRNPADRREIAQLNAQISALNTQIQTHERRATELQCT